MRRALCVAMLVMLLTAIGGQSSDDELDLKSLQVSMANLAEEVKGLKEVVYNKTQTWSETENKQRNRASMPTSCVDVRKYTTGSGIHTLNVKGYNVTVYCNQAIDGGGWTVIQRRRDNSVDFYRDWDQYEKGFGDLHGNFWLGLEKLHWLTSSRRHMLRVDLYDFHGASVYAKYNDFTVGGPDNYYRLYVSGYSGSAGDSLAYHNHQAFSTKDQDHDGHTSLNCASSYHGAWWYKSCVYSNLNGIYYTSPTTNTAGVSWYYWKKNYSSLRFVEMKIKPY